MRAIEVAVNYKCAMIITSCYAGRTCTTLNTCKWLFFDYCNTPVQWRARKRGTLTRCFPLHRPSLCGRLFP